MEERAAVVKLVRSKGQRGENGTEVKNSAAEDRRERDEEPSASNDMQREVTQ